MSPGAAIAIRLLLPVLASGCSTDRQVYVDLPLTRLELPEPAPRKFGTGPASGEGFRLELTPDQTTTTPDPERPRVLLEGNGQLHFDLQLPAPVTVGMKVYGANLFGVHAKWSVFSPRHSGGRTSLALTAAHAQGNSDFDYSLDSHTEIKQSLSDVAAIAGYRPHPNWLVFGGPFYSRLRYDGHYFSERGSDPDVDMDFAGDATLTGANLGLAFTPQNWLQITGEYSRARVEAG
ncbi:MAG: autotransporter outer membrane beta-barrel domain-containing protein, partial [Hydrocarboniphaga effusa]|nr:autotransporter outer membrane beta-barrel domain-containing protein [Hydrocarboniphaga effusa]